MLCEALKEAGYQDFYVDWGSDIRACGYHPDMRNFRTAIVEPPR